MIRTYKEIQEICGNILFYRNEHATVSKYIVKDVETLKKLYIRYKKDVEYYQRTAEEHMDKIKALEFKRTGHMNEWNFYSNVPELREQLERKLLKINYVLPILNELYNEAAAEVEKAQRLMMECKQAIMYLNRGIA